MQLVTKLREYVHNHGTKMLGFAQVTVGALAANTSLFTPRGLKVVLVTSGLLTAWRGYINSRNAV